MARYIALLRAVNAGGRGKLQMKEPSKTLQLVYSVSQTVR